MHLHVQMHVTPSLAIISPVLHGTYLERSMRHTYNGMAASDLHGLVWQKSRDSNANGQCVELAALPDGDVAVRNSRFPDGPALIYTKEEIESLIVGMKNGEFDHFVAN